MRYRDTVQCESRKAAVSGFIQKVGERERERIERNSRDQGRGGYRDVVNK